MAWVVLHFALLPYVGPSNAQTNHAIMPYVPSVDPYMKAVSYHVIQQ